MDGLTYIRLVIVGVGLAYAFVFGHVAGPAMALFIIGVLELASIADHRQGEAPG
ncbi:hypothetical protein [Bradyrhizobium macuxiense]|uniref:hypothetical protein n=1 Tax=Bradyrhizobium macuxiense TaxID=1755647 RepID=UPI000AFE0883|nr:hypothetical protein [Bradyrhizobium macuxiense]